MVFAPAVGYSDVSVGPPVAFRARVTRPKRRDLSVAVLAAVGTPGSGTASTGRTRRHTCGPNSARQRAWRCPPDQAAMLPGLVLGDVSAIESDTTAAFRRAGLTHLTAVSGANVTIVCGAVSSARRWSVRASPWRWRP